MKNIFDDETARLEAKVKAEIKGFKNVTGARVQVLTDLLQGTSTDLRNCAENMSSIANHIDEALKLIQPKPESTDEKPVAKIQNLATGVGPSSASARNAAARQSDASTNAAEAATGSTPDEG